MCDTTGLCLILTRENIYRKQVLACSYACDVTQLLLNGALMQEHEWDYSGITLSDLFPKPAIQVLTSFF